MSANFFQPRCLYEHKVDLRENMDHREYLKAYYREICEICEIFKNSLAARYEKNPKHYFTVFCSQKFI